MEREEKFKQIPALLVYFPGMMQSELIDSAALSVLVGRLGICLGIQLWDEFGVCL